MSNILNSEDFGLKIYNRFPPKYREDDVGQNFALKRYLQALSDGGFKYSIDEINGITHLIDPDKADSKVLPVLFQQYGLSIFNGIPEEYLRYLLPRLGEAWSKKGSISVIEFVSSSLSGVKTSTEITYDEFGNPNVSVIFEMDYSIGSYFPNSEQFKKLLTNFVPYYCDLAILYAYRFYDDINLKGDDTEEMIVHDTKEDSGVLKFEEYMDNVMNIIHTFLESTGVSGDDSYYQDKIVLPVIQDSSNVEVKEDELFSTSHIVTLEEGVINRRNISNPEYVAVLGQAVLGEAVFGYAEDDTDDFEDHITETLKEDAGNFSQFIDSHTNVGYNVLNSSFYTNGIHCYDIITIGEEKTIIMY